jgi:Zn-dependent M28 family amino/carboxypeptidase
MANSNFAVDLLIEPLKGTNIYTILPSNNNSIEYVVIGAHYDTDGKNFPGAIDIGSGIALITSVLRQVQEIKNRNRNLIVVYFDQEEESISAGSLAFAKFLKSNKYNIHSVHCFDLIGWDEDNNKEVLLDLPKPNAEIEGLYRKHAQKLNIPIYSIENNASDYSSFFKENINVIGISQAYAKGELSGKKDSPEDKFHLVDFEYLKSSTKLTLEVIKELIL